MANSTIIFPLDSYLPNAHNKKLHIKQAYSKRTGKLLAYGGSLKNEITQWFYDA
jgi:hypothetical protein